VYVGVCSRINNDAYLSPTLERAIEIKRQQKTTAIKQLKQPTTSR
jgi:hypothetical protein